MSLTSEFEYGAMRGLTDASRTQVAILTDKLPRTLQWILLTLAFEQGAVQAPYDSQLMLSISTCTSSEIQTFSTQRESYWQKDANSGFEYPFSRCLR